MCMISSLYEANQQKKAASEASRKATAASISAANQAQGEKNAADAQKAKEATSLEASDVASLSAAKKRQGIASTQLNKTLG